MKKSRYETPVLLICDGSIPIRRLKKEAEKIDVTYKTKIFTNMKSKLMRK